MSENGNDRRYKKILLAAHGGWHNDTICTLESKGSRRMLKVFEAFSGIGAQRMALHNLGIDYEVVAISEIDKFAVRSYEAIWGKTFNLGDISKLNVEDIPDHDLFTYSFPCTDLSVAGRRAGMEKGSGTASSLLYECERVIHNKKPKYLLLENVKNLVGKKFKTYFDDWLSWLEDEGYTNYWQVLNAKDYDVPQNRERVFVVSILGNEKYEFPEKQDLTKKVKDILEENVPDKFYLSEEKVKSLIPSKSISAEGINKVGDLSSYNREELGRVYNADGVSPTLNTMQGGDRQPKIAQLDDSESKDRDVFSVIGSTQKNAAVTDGSYAPTLTSVQKDNYVVNPNFTIRKLTPKECWRLMGFPDWSFEKAEEVNSNTQLYKQAGNSIVVPVLESIFKKLFVEKQEGLCIRLIEKYEDPKGLLHYVPKLTDKQQGIYTDLKYVYQSFCCVVPDDKDNAIVSICNILEGTEDHDAIPVLKKFISEVEE